MPTCGLLPAMLGASNPLDLASMLRPPTDYGLLALVFVGCVLAVLAARALGATLEARRTASPRTHPTIQHAANAILLRWHEALLVIALGLVVTLVAAAGLLMFRAGESALFSAALAITLLLTPLIVIVVEVLQVPQAERAAHGAAYVAGRIAPSENTTARRAA